MKKNNFGLLILVLLAVGCDQPDTIVKAVTDGDEHRVKSLLNSGEDPNQADAQGRSMLVLAVQLGHVNVVQALLQGGAEARVAYERIPVLNFAVTSTSCSIPIAKLLLDAGALPNEVDPVTRVSPLMNAASAGDLDCLNALIGAGADPNATDSMGESVMYHAAMSGKFSLVKATRELGVAIESHNVQGVTPLMVAAAGGYRDIAEYLLGEGANPCAMDAKGRRPADLALQNRHEDLVTMLSTCTDPT